eukprot:gnl/Spiro4/16445_TR8840_c0_g1_i1.p1 gnl/Spiro4/16445_TR8840_c0_g1~~gnl/Spiro4/16445_TR8840_c0_g1_i1.p1  ORF type:complete len:150 (+),score=25.62 gnl/Spiro4/16445_TR8840_c0_g1_i1:33-452(+)
MPVRHISLFFAVLLSFSHAELSPKKYKQFACYDENLSTNDLVNIGMKYDGQGDTKESRFCFQRVHFALALRQFNAGDFEQCVKKAGEAVTLGTDQKNSESTTRRAACRVRKQSGRRGSCGHTPTRAQVPARGDAASSFR